MRYLFALLSLFLPTLTFAVPLASWNDGPRKAAIIKFVEAVSAEGGRSYVDPADRIAVFDNDGTLWAEQPAYFQLAYALDAFAKLAADNPDLANSDALKAAAAGDVKGTLAGGEDTIRTIFRASTAGQSVAAYQKDVRQWYETARHQQTGLRYGEMTYAPMIELLDYLRANDFEVYIVSGGGLHFMRAFAETAYGVPPQNVIGSYVTTTYENGQVMLDEGVGFIDDKAGKPVGIMTHIGKRPIFAAGNSDGDYEMLDWVTSGLGPRFGMIVHHTDGVREFAYDRGSHIGELDRAWDVALDGRWQLVDMAQDWAEVYGTRN